MFICVFGYVYLGMCVLAVCMLVCMYIYFIVYIWAVYIYTCVCIYVGVCLFYSLLSPSNKNISVAYTVSATFCI